MHDRATVALAIAPSALARDSEVVYDNEFSKTAAGRYFTNLAISSYLGLVAATALSVACAQVGGQYE
jgi:hypothetical protein